MLDAAAAAKSLQSCPTLCDPIDGSPLGSSVPGILQACFLSCTSNNPSNISVIFSSLMGHFEAEKGQVAFQH